MTDKPAVDAPTPAPNSPRSRSLFRSSLVTGSMTMLSRVLGLARDLVLAHVLGAGGSADAFFMAFKIPNFFRRLFSEGAFSQAFVPVLSEYRQNGSHAAVQQLVNRVAASLGSALLLVTLLCVVGAPVVATLFASGFKSDPAKFQQVTDLIRITFPYLLLISLTGFAGAILNSYDRFAAPAFTPVLLNVCMILAAVFAAPYFDDPSTALAWSVLVAGVLSLLFQLPFLQRIHLLPRPVMDWKDPGVVRILTLMGPAIFGVSVSQINLMLDALIASHLPDGSVGWLYYSDRLVELPLGVFGVAIATVIMPSLSRQAASQSREQFSATLDWALRFVLLIALPATCALVVLAEPILYTLFYHGKMQIHDIEMSAWALRAYALGLLGFMLIKILVSGYFARQDMKTPVKIGIKAIAANIIMKPIVVVPLALFMALGHVGLALTTALAAYVNAGLLYRGLRRSEVYVPGIGWPARWLKFGLANAGMGLVLVALVHYWPDFEVLSMLERVWRLAVICGSGIITYVAILALVGFRVRDFTSRG